MSNEVKKVKVDGNILAHGEATGHMHVAHGDGVEVWEEGGVMTMHAPNGASISHQEHNVIPVPAIPEGTRISRVQEFDPLMGARDVTD